MNWYKYSKLDYGQYLMDLEGKLYPSGNRPLKDMLPFFADKYNMILNAHDPDSEEYQLGVMENGIAIISITPEKGVMVEKIVNSLNQAQQEQVKNITTIMNKRNLAPK